MKVGERLQCSCSTPELTSVPRNLERVTPCDADELRHAWRRYREVIAQLDETTAEFEALRTCTG